MIRTPSVTFTTRFLPALVATGMTAAPPSAPAAPPCAIRVVDAENGWPVPLVKLTTTHGVTFHTDNAGVVAFDLPELMGRETWLSIASDGYEVDADGFGNRGRRITPEPGGDHRIELTRKIIAKRLGRLTGGGLFGESQRLGEHLDWSESGILGSDSVQIAVHRGKLFWAWGDTTVPRYPLGLFHMTSAVTSLRPLASLEPPVKLDLRYFRDDAGRVRNVADVAPDNPGPTWISGYLSLPDTDGIPRLVGHYAKIEPPLTTYRTGLCVWNEDREHFASVAVLWDRDTDGAADEPPPSPVGHPAFWTDEEGRRWVLFGDPLPTLKLPARYEAWLDPDQWETLTPPETLAASDDQTAVKPHRGSIAWNAWRDRWVTVFTQIGGKPSLLGEVWYAEADSPLGPWGPAVKILTHHDYSFYNPRLHPDISPPDSPVLLFEGTYAATFSGAPVPTPRHDYNQILYRLDLDDPRLAPAHRTPE